MTGWLLILLFVAGGKPAMTTAGPFASQTACQTAAAAWRIGIDHSNKENGGMPLPVCVAQAEVPPTAALAKQ